MKIKMKLSLLFLVYFGYSFTDGNNDVVLSGCNSVARVRPNIPEKYIFDNLKDKLIQLRFQVSFKQHYGDKGCSRDTYETIETFKKCGIEKPIPLLPLLLSKPATFIQNVEKEVTSKGGLDYVFDGGTAVRYPTATLPSNWYEKYSLSGWVLTSIYNERQYVISWSDGDTLRHDNMGFYTARRPTSNHITFGFHHMHQHNGDDCMLKVKWRLKEDAVQWNFFVLSFHECSVELMINGKKIEPLSSSLKFHLPEKHIQPKFVIGARWVGSVMRYRDYFHGKISGLMLKTGMNINQNMNECLYECKEQLHFGETLPPSFQQYKDIGGNNITITGASNKEYFLNIINNILYTNKDDMLYSTKRTINFYIEDELTKKKVNDNINVEISRLKSNLTISGDCSGERETPLFFKQGVRLCDNLQINFNSCIETIDTMTVDISPTPVQGEKIYIASPFLKRHQLSFVSTKTGFIVYGVALVSQYTEIMYHIKYAYNGLFSKDISRKISISVSGKNGLIVSNKYSFYVHASKHQVIVSNYEQVDNVVANTLYFSIGKQDDEIVHIPLPGKEIAMKTNKSNRHHILLILACSFSSVMLISILAIPIFHWRRNRDQDQKINRREEESIEDENTAVTFWEQEDLPMTLRINPTERVSITNDPYTELLLQKKFAEEATTDGSVCSEDDMTDFDTDSIRRLEWDFLENSVEKIMKEERAKKSLQSEMEDCTAKPLQSETEDSTPKTPES